MKAVFSLSVNGTTHVIQTDPEMPLLYVLRNELSLKSPKFGCGMAQCGACTVMLNGVATRSCVLPVSSVTKEVTTLEGLSDGRRLHPVQQALVDEQAPQCACCINGMIMTALAFLGRKPKATAQEIRKALNNNLCRCGAHTRIVRAIERVSQFDSGEQ